MAVRKISSVNISQLQKYFINLLMKSKSCGIKNNIRLKLLGFK